MNANATDPVRSLCEDAVRRCHGGPHEAQARAVLVRLDGPLRVAIAGRLKAGKSTLLNALIGERVAATDAGECTQIVTTYRHGGGYEVAARLRRGGDVPLTITQHDGAWRIDLRGHVADEIDRLDVAWPSSVLRSTTLIDTPGLGSLTEAASRRSIDFLGVGTEEADDGADAVIYLMRHLHRLDAEFLGAFMDRRVIGASPINAIAVLARPDEIGACRADAMISARRIAERYAADPMLRTLVSDVVPVVGLLAETAQTLREQELASLRSIASAPAETRERMLSSVDDFCDVSASDLTVETRRELLGRLGIFGVRIALSAVAADPAITARGLADLLLEQSGLAELRRVIAERFVPRAHSLKLRSTFAALRSLERAMRATDSGAADVLARDIEAVELRSSDAARLLVAHLVMSEAVRTSAAERDEVAGVLLAGDPSRAARARFPSEDTLLDAIERWRRRAADPRAGGLVLQTCDTMALVYERALSDAGPAA